MNITNSKSSSRTLLICTFMLLSVATTVGCSTREKGPYEKAGEKVDEIADDIAEGDNPFRKKGPAEKTGEKIDDAING